MKEKCVYRKNISILEDMTYEIKKYSFTLKLILDAQMNDEYKEYKNEISSLLFDYSNIIELFANDLWILMNCMLKGTIMNRKN